MDPDLCNPSTDEERAAAVAHFAQTVIDDVLAAPSFPENAVRVLLGERPARTDWQVIAAWEPQPLSGADEANVALDGVKRALAGPLEHPGMLGHLTIVRTHLEAALTLATS